MQEKLEIHVGSHSPEVWARRATTPVRAGLRPITGPQIATENIDWEAMGLVPRWIGDDPSTAVAALEATELHASDWARFQLGTERRNEPALYISTSTPPDHADPGLPDWGNVLLMGQGRALGLELPHEESVRIRVSPITLARAPELADGLSDTDRDLALRIRNTAGARWMALDPYDPDDPDEELPDMWTPLLITPDGYTVAGRWTDDDESPPIHHYVIPSLPSYEPILRWLVERAVPDLIPAAAARTRHYIADQPNLQSTRERGLTDKLTTLTTTYEQAKAELDQALADERAAVSVVREPLLFGSGTPLEKAVLRVLVDAGVEASRLDDELGPRSADLLAEYGGRRVLIEVKSAGGPAKDALAGFLEKHLRSWPHLRPDQPSLNGGVLVVNHQLRLPPAERTHAVYSRPEFLAGLGFPVVSTLELFHLWRLGDFAGIRTAFGLESPATST